MAIARLGINDQIQIQSQSHVIYLLGLAYSYVQFLVSMV